MLTALMPLRNHHPPFLRRAVESLLAQTNPHWQLIVIAEREDLAMARTAIETASQDARIVVLANDGAGLSAAFNSGMRAARSEFVAILLADDLWSADAVEVLSEAIGREPGVDFFHSARRIVDENELSLSSIHPPRHDFTREDFYRTSPVKHLLCWRRSMALSIGGMDESLPPVGPDDYDFPWTMWEAGALFRALPQCLYIYRDHRETFRLTTHLPLALHKEGIRRILEKHGVDAATVEARLTASERTYLRQCLFESWEDKQAREGSGLDPRLGWRDTYR